MTAGAKPGIVATGAISVGSLVVWLAMQMSDMRQDLAFMRGQMVLCARTSAQILNYAKRLPKPPSESSTAPLRDAMEAGQPLTRPWFREGAPEASSGHKDPG